MSIHVTDATNVGSRGMGGAAGESQWRVCPTVNRSHPSLTPFPTAHCYRWTRKPTHRQAIPDKARQIQLNTARRLFATVEEEGLTLAHGAGLSPFPVAPSPGLAQEGPGG